MFNLLFIRDFAGAAIKIAAELAVAASVIIGIPFAVNTLSDAIIAHL